MKRAQRMLLGNNAWAIDSALTNPVLFEELTRAQNPKVLWIGCSESHVPAEIMTKCSPGDLFVYRNIANLFSTTDDNSMSVLEYAIKFLKVDDIIVCGHYGCGGVKAALHAPSGLPHVVRRVSPICALASTHIRELSRYRTSDEQANRLAELNVVAQVETIRATSIVRDAPHRPSVHGWIFGLHDGRIKVLTAGERQLQIVAQTNWL